MQKGKRTKNEATLREYQITNNVEISPGVYVISFTRDFEFQAGQVVKVALNIEVPPRIYSICSGNKEEEIRILFNIKDDGYLTPKLATMIPGEKILVSEPYGTFIGTKEKAWFIATGTGVAPFYSMIKSNLYANKTLIHGVRHLNQFYFEDELEEVLNENFIRCCSKESSCDTIPGRVTDYIKSIHDLPDTKYYLCGQALMVVEVRDLLINKGVKFDKIMSEIYF